MKLTEKIGANVLAAQKRRVSLIEDNFEKWKQEGHLFQQLRNKLRVSRKQIKQCIGCADSVLKRLEEGLYVKRRNVIVNSYITALRYIAQRDFNALGKLVRH